MPTAGTSPSAMLSTANGLEAQLQTQLTAIRQAPTREEIVPLIAPLGEKLTEADNLLVQARTANVSGTALDRLAARVGEARGVLVVLRTGIGAAEAVRPISAAEIPGLRQTLSQLTGEMNALQPGQLPQGSIAARGPYLGELQKRVGIGRPADVSAEDWTALITLANQFGEALSRHTGSPSYPLPVNGGAVAPGPVAGEAPFWEKAKPYVPWVIGGVLLIAVLKKL